MVVHLTQYCVKFHVKRVKRTEAHERRPAQFLLLVGTTCIWNIFSNQNAIFLYWPGSLAAWSIWEGHYVSLLKRKKLFCTCKAKTCDRRRCLIIADRQQFAKILYKKEVFNFSQNTVNFNHNENLYWFLGIPLFGQNKG